MSFTATKVTGAKENLVISVPADGDTVGAGATPETNVGASGSDQAHTVYALNIDGSDNPNEDVTLRLYDTRSAPTVGTDAAWAWFRGKRGRGENDYHFPMGLRFTKGVSLAVVKDAGGTGGSSGPSGTVRVQLRIKAP